MSYWAVIFTSVRVPHREADGYGDAATRMVELARQMPGFLSVESVRGADGVGITVSYWADESAIRTWREHAEHTLVREQGRRDWYESFTVRVCRVEREYSFTKESSG